MDFKKLKSLRGKQSLTRLNEEVAKVQETGRKVDDRFWSPTVDKSGNGYCIIRFLPAPPNEDLPFIRLFDHGFKGPSGLWYIENSLTTLGQSDPVSEYNSKLWNSTVDDSSPARKQAREQKRRLHFISNIYVISDPANPDTEGKVYLYKFGKKIFNKISEKLEPEFVDEEAFNPFDLWEGANFKLKIRHVDGYRNYDRSEFEKNGPLFDDDEKLEMIWKSQHGLKEFTDPSNFKTYEELKEKLAKVMSENILNKVEKEPDLLNIKDDTLSSSRGKTLESKSPSSLNMKEDEDEDLEYFQKLVG
jgi:hypothetical protein